MYRGIVSVEVKENYKLSLCFDNGEKRIFDAKPILSYGRFKELTDVNRFKNVRISFDTIEWDNGLDLDPEYLYAKSREI